MEELSNHNVEEHLPKLVSPDWQAQQVRWLQDVIRMMAAVITIAAVPISIGIIAGIFDIAGTLPIYVLLALIIPTWFAARRFGWRWLGVVPVLLCFSLGIYGSIANYLLSNFILFYALSVLLAGMLFTNRAAIILLIFSILAYGGLGLRNGGSLVEALPFIITFVFALVGILMLQWYTYARHYLVEKRGLHFDPAIVDLFLQIV